MSGSEAPTGFLPAQGSTVWYDTLLKLLESRQITKVDKAFLENQDPKIASHNETKLIAGLKFLGLIDKEGNATEAMGSLSVAGDKRKENLQKVVRTAYCLLFVEVKMDLEKAEANTLINSFKTDYKMGSLRTAKDGAKIFVFLAQKAEIALSESIVKELSTSLERKRTTQPVSRKPRQAKEDEQRSAGEGRQEPIPEEALARFTLKGVGSVDIKDEDTFGLAKAFMKVLAKKLGIAEKEES